MSEPALLATQNQTEPEHKTWFDHMTGYLRWKVIGPDIFNPYKVLPPLHVLKRMTNDLDFLGQFINVRCLCDGFEVMNIQNPCLPRVWTDHPVILRLDMHIIGNYMRRTGIDEFIHSEMVRIQEEVTTLVTQAGSNLENREDAGSPNIRKPGHKSGANAVAEVNTIAALRGKLTPKASRQYRLIKK